MKKKKAWTADIISQEGKLLTSAFYLQSFYNYASVLVHVADRVIYLGLAPEIPEDLYMLIKKVRSHGLEHGK